MKIATLVSGTLCLFVYGCTAPDTDAQEIARHSVDSHGGMEQWQRLAGIRFKKTTTLYKENGFVEYKSIESHSYTLHPSFAAQIEWENGDTRYRIEQDSAGTRLYMGDSLVTDAAQLENAARKIDAGWYTVSQPFNLVDSDRDIQLTHQGRDTLETGSIVEVVQVDYPEADSDRWWYYFDVDNHLCRGNMVEHDSTYAFIETVTYDQSTPLLLHQYRKTYRVNHERKIRFTRANYKYEDYEVEFLP